MLTVEPELIARYVATGQIYYVFRPVLNHGERSLRTSEAAACAAEQERFWPMHELLFQRQDEVWGVAESELPALMSRYAGELGLDQAAFNACVAGGEAWRWYKPLMLNSVPVVFACSRFLRSVIDALSAYNPSMRFHV